MKLPRRQFLHLTAGAVALPVMLSTATAQSYPSRPVHLIVPYPPGGGADLLARMMSPWLSERLGQQFVVENRSGAAGNLGTESVARARADGYTLLLAVSPNAINASLYDNLNFNFIRDIAPVAALIRVPNIMVVNPSVPAKSVPEFVAYAKANPGKLNVASSGIGTTLHIAGELFKMMTGINMVNVLYRGAGPARTDLLGGQVQVMFDPIPQVIEHVEAGRLRALGVTTATRSEMLPTIPAINEFVPGYDADTWYGVGAPRNTPTEVIYKLNKEINEGLTDPKMKARLAELGGTVSAGSPADFGKLIADETEKWGKVIRAANIKPE
jgi:tripartite-type tricarboxylate transporter receptor subunit TctC